MSWVALGCIGLRFLSILRELFEGDGLEVFEKNGSSGRTRTYNPPVNSQSAGRSFNNFTAQMTTFDDAEIHTISLYLDPCLTHVL
jgi:hypothetical protein